MNSAPPGEPPEPFLRLFTNVVFFMVGVPKFFLSGEFFAREINEAVKSVTLDFSARNFARSWPSSSRRVSTDLAALLKDEYREEKDKNKVMEEVKQKLEEDGAGEARKKKEDKSLPI